jgi:hypothetical protein
MELLVGQRLLAPSPSQVVSVIQPLQGPLALLEQGVTTTLLVELVVMEPMLVVVVVAALPHEPVMGVMVPMGLLPMVALGEGLEAIMLLGRHPALQPLRLTVQPTA